MGHSMFALSFCPINAYILAWILMDLGADVLPQSEVLILVCMFEDNLCSQNIARVVALDTEFFFSHF